MTAEALIIVRVSVWWKILHNDVTTVRVSSQEKKQNMESSIRLVVKTPNQRFKDIHIDCDLGWTVKKLKEYLANVHPTNPVIYCFCFVFDLQFTNITGLPSKSKGLGLVARPVMIALAAAANEMI